MNRRGSAIEEMLEALQERRAIARILNIVKGSNPSEERVVNLVPIFDHSRHTLKYLGRISTVSETESSADALLERISSQVC